MLHVVVVAYKSAAHIAACLAPLMDDALVGSVVVVDNSADPATEAACRRWSEDRRLEYVPSPNIGYAAACNLGFSRARGAPEFFAVVNPDLTLTRPLSELAKHASRATGTIFSAVLDEDMGSNARPLVSPGRELLGALIGSRAYSFRWPPRPIPLFHQVPQIDGSLMLISSREVEALGTFDERFELYFEDVDLCRRASERFGCQVLLEPWGKHHGGASFAVAGEAPFVALRVSRARYLRKWYGITGLLTGLLVAVTEFVVRAITGRAPSRRALGRALVAQLREVLQPGRAKYLA